MAKETYEYTGIPERGVVVVWVWRGVEFGRGVPVARWYSSFAERRSLSRSCAYILKRQRPSTFAM